MTWLAVCDRVDRRFSMRGLGIDKRQAPVLTESAETRLTRGTLLFETRLSADARPQVLFGYNRAHPATRSLTFQAIPGGGIAMVQVQGGAIRHAAVYQQGEGRTDVVRITYAWDSTQGWGRMTLEKPEETQITSVPVDDPLPLSLEDIRDLMLGRTGATFAADMIFAGLSDQIEPVGPMPTLLPSTPIATAQGYMPLRDLGRGDTLRTPDDGIVPVLNHVTRVVPARGSFRPIRLRAPYFGLRQDIIVSPDQRLLIDGPEVEYLFGQEAVLVPARHLVNGFAAMKEPCGPTICYQQLLLPRNETVLAAGTAVESLYIGRLRRDKQHMAGSLLASVERNLLPEHQGQGHYVLRWYDAIHLARRRAA